MATSRITCPECRSVLKPAKPIPDGKKVKCPKCGHSFITPGLVEREEERPRKKGSRKEKAGIQKAASPKPPPKKRDDDDDDEGGGVYSYVSDGEKTNEEEVKPEINYAPDMSIKDLRGPAQAAVVKPSNFLILICGLSVLCDIFIICYCFWPMVFSDSVVDHEKFLEKYYKDQGTKDAAAKIKSIPKDRKEVKDKERAALEDAESAERIERFAWMGGFIGLLLYNVVAMIGAVKMQNLESRRWGITCCIMLLFPMGAGGIIGAAFLLVKNVGGLLLDELAEPYAMGVGGLVYLISIIVAIGSLRTLMSQEVIDGFEYVAE